MRSLFTLLVIALVLFAAFRVTEGSACALNRSGEIVVLACRSPLFAPPSPSDR